MRTSFVVLAVLPLLGCGSLADPSVEPAALAPEELADFAQPLTGSDGADHGCQVVLRGLERQTTPLPAGPSSCTGGTCWFVWNGTLELSATAVSQGSRPGVSYRSSWDGKWHSSAATAVPGASAGFQRYQFQLKRYTAPAGASTSSLNQTRIEVAPFLRTAAGVRLFDHNRNPGPFDNYVLESGNNFQVSALAALCGAASPARAVVEFPFSSPPVQHGSLVPGGTLVIQYPIEKLGSCRGTHNGFPAWDVRAVARFLPAGQQLDGTVRGFDAPGGVPHGPGQSVPLELQVPAGATGVEMWFHNIGALDGCEAYDSNLGQNYAFAVVGSLPSAVGWAGNWGGSFARDCLHRDGLQEPNWVDDYVQTRACTFIDADVYVPGLTDVAGEHPERIAAQAAYSIDGKPAAPAWLTFAGRVGNNYRYRWQLPRGSMNYEFWNTYRYAFRFSTDGAKWFQVAQADGPVGGAERSIERQASWCNPSWASCSR